LSHARFGADFGQDCRLLQVAQSRVILEDFGHSGHQQLQPFFLLIGGLGFSKALAKIKHCSWFYRRDEWFSGILTLLREPSG